MSNLFLHWTGGDNGSGVQYLELSGFLSIVIPPLLTVLGLYLTYWWHTRCHIDGCFKKARYPFHHYRLCKKHHPEAPLGKLTHWHIIKIHREGQKNGDNT